METGLLKKVHARTLLLGCFLVVGPSLYAEKLYLDLTHRTPTYAPLDGDMNKPDMSKPNGSSDRRGIPTFGPQTVYMINPPFKTGQGYFYSGRLATSEHHGTHIDAPSHYHNDNKTLEMTKPAKTYIHEMSPDDLIGPAVLVDISSRVAAELDKNGGKPSKDTKVTDFSNSSANVVTADDIAAIEDQLENNSWIVINLGWSRFYHSADWEKSPYINGFNFPGLNKKAVDKIIEIEYRKKIRINGVIADNIGIDSGESSIGDGKFQGAFYSHVRGLQRGWKMVENANYLNQLAQAKKGSCTIIIGAPNHIMGSGGPARVMAICEK